jgi:16S rRNA (cytosine1402-N4)-methyltransferase
MTDFVHVSVMPDELVRAVLHNHGTWYVDLTAGGGGHSGRLLRQSPDARVLAVDRDPRAVAACTLSTVDCADRITIVQSTFDAIANRVEQLGFGAPHPDGGVVDGIMADLGVSSPQLDDAERGFSWSRPGPLDMRMGDDGPTLLELLHSTDAEDLAAMLREGEVTGAGRIARALTTDVRSGRITNTLELGQLCERVLGRSRTHHPATLVFQALRMVVNDELGQLRRVLEQAKTLVRPSGMVAFLTFHSLEDRIVKQAFRSWSEAPPVPRGLPVISNVAMPFGRPWKQSEASDSEVAANPRARSARLRVVQRHPLTAGAP